MKAYTTIFAQILRLRQTCCHPTLVRNQDIVAEEELASAEADAAAGLSDDMDLQSLIQQFTAVTGDARMPTLSGLMFLSKSVMRRLMNAQYVPKNLWWIRQLQAVGIQPAKTVFRTT